MKLKLQGERTTLWVTEGSTLEEYQQLIDWMVGCEDTDATTARDALGFAAALYDRAMERTEVAS